jgi:hypothetical protein
LYRTKSGDREFNIGTEIADRENASTHIADATPGMTADLREDGALHYTDDGDVSCCYVLYSYYWRVSP